MKTTSRTELREPISLLLQLAGGSDGVTRDVSASGVYFETSSEQQVGDLIAFEIELDTSIGPMKFIAQAQIVRIEPQGKRTGIGVRLLASRLLVVE
jgi:hypothetical protein